MIYKIYINPINGKYQIGSVNHSVDVSNESIKFFPNLYNDLATAEKVLQDLIILKSIFENTDKKSQS